MKLSKILVAVDFSKASDAAVKMATVLARDTGAKLMIVHVESSESVCGGDEMDSLPVPLDNPKVRRQLEAVRPEGEGVEVEHHLLVGSPGEEIVRFAERRQVDLIVLGTNGHTGVGRLFVGSVAQWVVRHASCPVMTLKPPAE